MGDYIEMVQCATDEFWKQMCRPGFVRIDFNHGQIGATRYHVDKPPESIDGFIEEKLDSIVENLQLKTPPLAKGGHGEGFHWFQKT